jgi:predicted MFS family arabinose efflux permease
MSALRNRGLLPTRRQRSEEHGVVVLIRTLLLFESAMYSAVTPVLPHYQHVLHASKPAIGVLAAGYAAGLIPGSLLAWRLATRVGVRRTTVFGLLAFAAAVLPFGFGTQIVTLDGLRFVQGMACGFIWGGGLAWVISVAPRERRGEIIGTVFAGAIFGTLLGPVLGTLAVAGGTELVFSLVALASVAFAVWSSRFPDPPAVEATTRTPLKALVTNRRMMLGAWLILLEACTVGATGTLLPLRLSRFGASGVAIGVVFLLTALISTFLATPFGRVVDRRGSGVLLTVGLTTTAVLLAILPIPQSVVLLALVCVIALGGPLTAYAIPAMTIITDAAERAGIPVVVATLLLNLAWATGETIGAPAAASISQATSDAVPLLLLAALMVITLVPVLRAHLGPAHTGPPADDDAAGHESEPVAVASG